jgi:hypothetical protein
LEESYIPDNKEVLLDIEEEENALSYRSDTLPIAFVLISYICQDGSSNYICVTLILFWLAVEKNKINVLVISNKMTTSPKYEKVTTFI